MRAKKYLSTEGQHYMAHLDVYCLMYSGSLRDRSSITFGIEFLMDALNLEKEPDRLNFPYCHNYPTFYLHVFNSPKNPHDMIALQEHT